MVENCKNIVIKIEDKVITGMVDIWKSENISLDVSLERRGKKASFLLFAAIRTKLTSNFNVIIL